MCKNTYGTGSFVLLSTGVEPRISQAGMLATVAWQLKGEATYAMEGAIFVTGALQFQADQLEIPVLRAATAETTALGACFLAGLAGGVWASLDEISEQLAGSRPVYPGDGRTGTRAPGFGVAPGGVSDPPQILIFLNLIFTKLTQGLRIMGFTAEPYSIPSLEKPETPLGLF